MLGLEQQHLQYSESAKCLSRNDRVYFGMFLIFPTGKNNIPHPGRQAEWIAEEALSPEKIERLIHTAYLTKSKACDEELNCRGTDDQQGEEF